MTLLPRYCLSSLWKAKKRSWNVLSRTVSLKAWSQGSARQCEQQLLSVTVSAMSLISPVNCSWSDFVGTDQQMNSLFLFHRAYRAI